MALTGTFISALHNSFFIILGIFGIGFLIGFHELGHFLFCKLFHIKTPSFSIGFGPKLFQRKVGETNFVLSAIPLGGYVEIAGSAEVGQGEQAEAHSTEEDSFANKPYWQKMLVMLGGILFNLIFAYVVLSLLFYSGMPETPILETDHTTKIVEVAPKSPASEAGIRAGDTIVSLSGQATKLGNAVLEKIKEHPNKQFALTIDRNGKKQEINVTTGQHPEIKQPYGYLGVNFESPRLGFFESIKRGFHATNAIVYKVFEAFKSIFTKKQFNNLGGPILIISQTIKSAAKGFKIFLLLLVFISINLAVLNIIPLPIFDGGQMLFHTIEAIIRRPLPDRIREYIHYATWILVILLAAYLSVKDLGRLGVFHGIWEKIKLVWDKVTGK